MPLLALQASVISNVRTAAQLPRDEPNREETMAAVGVCRCLPACLPACTHLVAACLEQHPLLFFPDILATVFKIWLVFTWPGFTQPGRPTQIPRPSLCCTPGFPEPKLPHPKPF